MDGRKTDTDDLVERLEDSKGWPNLGKAAAARIRALEAERDEARAIITTLRNNIPMEYLQIHDKAAATSPTESCDVAAAMRDYAEDRWKLIERLRKMPTEKEADAKVIEAAEMLADEYESLIMNVARSGYSTFPSMLGEFNLDQDLDALAAFRQAQQARAALEEKNDDKG
jgi:hypothetical protein